jgi:hypothetical protein
MSWGRLWVLVGVGEVTKVMAKGVGRKGSRIVQGRNDSYVSWACTISLLP